MALIKLPKPSLSLKVGAFVIGSCFGVLASSAWKSVHAEEFSQPQTITVGSHTVAIFNNCLLSEVDGEAVNPAMSVHGHLDYYLNNGDYAEVVPLPNRKACKIYVGHDERLIFISELKK